MQTTLAQPTTTLPSSARRALPAERSSIAPAAPQASGVRTNGRSCTNGPRRLSSLDLLEGEREIEIEHAGSVYRLRRTALGKLILTK